MKATSTRRETSGPRRDYAKLHAGSMRASPGTTQALAEQAFEVLSSGGANSQKEAAAMMGINEKAVSRVKLKTKAPYTKCHTGSTQTVELELGVTWTKELSYGDSKAERGEAQARAERNYKRKRAALAEVARRRAAEDCGGGALSEPMDEAEEDASRRESASKVGSPTLGRYYDIIPIDSPRRQLAMGGIGFRRSGWHSRSGFRTNGRSSQLSFAARSDDALPCDRISWHLISLEICAS